MNFTDLVFSFCFKHIILPLHPKPMWGRQRVSGRLKQGRRFRMLYSDMRTFYTIALAAVLLTMFGNTASAQRWSISTNMLDYADFLTLNVEGGVSVHRHWSVSVKGRYNPFYFRTDSADAVNVILLTQNREILFR